jgi:epsilon-lactone hydrolase
LGIEVVVTLTLYYPPSPKPHIMIRQSADEFLAVVKQNSPEAPLPTPTLRQNFSEFYKEMQDEALSAGDHHVGKVSLPNGVTGNWITVPDTHDDRVILFFHGGGFTTGSTDDHLGLCVRLARASCAKVFSVDYRLSPEHPFPAPVEDAVSAYRYLTTNGIQPHRILPVGISVGANLVLALLLSLRDEKIPLPLAAVCMSPFVDMQFPGESVQKNQNRDWVTKTRLDSIRTLYLGGNDPQNPLASPVHARLAGLPRLYIQVGTHELILSDIGKFVDRARWAGVPVQAEIWEGMFHCWQIFSDEIPEGQEATDHIGAFAEDVLSR